MSVMKILFCWHSVDRLGTHLCPGLYTYKHIQRNPACYNANKTTGLEQITESSDQLVCQICSWDIASDMQAARFALMSCLRKNTLFFSSLHDESGIFSSRALNWPRFASVDAHLCLETLPTLHYWYKKQSLTNNAALIGLTCRQLFPS